MWSTMASVASLGGQSLGFKVGKRVGRFKLTYVSASECIIADGKYLLYALGQVLVFLLLVLKWHATD